ncbi:ribonuclease P protein subunit [Candidatus Bathyarchaeota archaeon]|nr:ribonuclease P protein subunit [Candidatus Bathyarchaeota archaeon]
MKHELIGLKVKISCCKNLQLNGLEGLIIDETKNTLCIQTNGKIKLIPKDISIFHIFLPNGKIVEVNGKILVGRPENRLKMRLKRW